MKMRLLSSGLALGLLLSLVLLVAFVGCQSDPTPPIVPSPKGTDFLLLLKDGKPFLLASVKQMVPHLRTLSQSAREEYLMRKAAAVVLEKALADERYVGQQAFTVNMVLPLGEDEYHRPRWGGAKEIAVLEVDRQRVTGLTAQSVEGLDASALRGLFVSARFSTDGL